MSSKGTRVGAAFVHGALSGYDSLLKARRQEEYETRIEEARMERAKNMRMWEEQSINAPVRAAQQKREDTIRAQDWEREDDPFSMRNLHAAQGIELQKQQLGLQRDQFDYSKSAGDRNYNLEVKKLALEVEKASQKEGGLPKHLAKLKEDIDKSVISTQEEVNRELLALGTDSKARGEILERALAYGLNPKDLSGLSLGQLRSVVVEAAGDSYQAAAYRTSGFYQALTGQPPPGAGGGRNDDPTASEARPLPIDLMVSASINYDPNTKDPEQIAAYQKAKKAYDSLPPEEQKKVDAARAKALEYKQQQPLRNKAPLQGGMLGGWGPSLEEAEERYQTTAPQYERSF